MNGDDMGFWDVAKRMLQEAAFEVQGEPQKGKTTDEWGTQFTTLILSM